MQLRAADLVHPLVVDLQARVFAGLDHLPAAGAGLAGGVELVVVPVAALVVLALVLLRWRLAQILGAALLALAAPVVRRGGHAGLLADARCPQAIILSRDDRASWRRGVVRARRAT